jgi:replicative DNA helicase
MIDAKIINWMLKGSIELNGIYREIEHDLLNRVVLPTMKPAETALYQYYSRHKIPPSFDVLYSLLDEEGEDPEIARFIETESCAANEVGYFLDKIKERYNKFLISRVGGTADDVKRGEESVEDFNENLKKVVSQTEKLYKNDVFSEGMVSMSVEDRIRDYEYTAENPEEIRGFLSGYPALDEYTWGIKNSEMLVIGGASSSGKSLLMMNMAINAWRGTNVPDTGDITANDGKNILYVSLEMSKKQLEQRLDANIAQVSHRGVMRGRLNDDEKKRWNRGLKFQKNYDKVFYILDLPRGSSMGEIEAKFESIMGIFRPDAIFIDYLQLMKPILGTAGSDWLDVGKVSEEMHEFCRKKDIPVITAAQRKAAGKKKNGKQEDNVSLEDFGRSKMIGDNAAIAFIIGNREDEELREDIQIHIVKNRDGPKGTVSLRKVFAKSRIEDFPDDWVEDPGDENAI